jgi:hypothetical protein
MYNANISTKVKEYVTLSFELRYISNVVYDLIIQFNSSLNTL